MPGDYVTDEERAFGMEVLLENAVICLGENDIDNAYMNLEEAAGMEPTKGERVQILRLLRTASKGFDKRAASLARGCRFDEAEAEWEKPIGLVEKLGYAEQGEGLRKSAREKIRGYASGFIAPCIMSAVDGLLMLNRYITGLNGSRPNREATLQALYCSAAKFYMAGDRASYRQAMEGIESIRSSPAHNETR